MPPALQLPGAPAFSPSLQQELRSAWKAQAGASQPRTSHLNADGSPQYINRLVLSRSPYLQQHAFNPVNWYPWGDEAFATAKRENKPVFLSIGYATCHWCHVMEHECFEEEAIAKLLNENFIAVKVDREERPDIDAVYIAAVQRMTGSAGWPLSVFLTSDRQPFYGGTYFPPEDAGNRPGFPKLLKMLKTAWDTKRDSVVEASTEITKAVRDAANMSPGGTLDEVVLLRAAAHFATMFDPVNGGFGKAPKFPQAHVLRFLCRYSYRTGDAVAQNMAFASLDHMARGGMNDLIGGGFHRYSTDAEWRVPHYEKMLYDQAMDAQAYLEAMRASDGAAFRDTPREIFTYVLRDMTSPDGAFYTAEDADSGGEEGRFYTWTRKELVGVLGPQDGPLFADLFGMNDSEVPQPLTLAVNTADFLKQRKINPQQFVRTMAKMRVGLMSERLKRPRPARDDKIITAWNGLMIAALADGAKTLHDENLAVAAARAADFVLTHLQRDGRLLRVYRGSAGTIPGYLDDYAYLIHGLHELYEATFESRWLLEADRLSREMIRLFDDPATGALRYAADDHEKLIAASNSLEDQALPAPQSVAAYELLRLGRLTMNKAYESRGRALLALNGADVEQSPTAYAFRLMALDFAIGPTQEIVLAGARNDPKIKGLATTLYSLYAPRAVVALHDADDKKIEQLVPFLRQQNMVGGRATAYVCENYVCKLPTSEVEKLRSLVLAIRDSQAKADKAAGEQHTSPPAPAPLP
ncbi:MAG: thioredoxin domain-containing protein [Deltaproteobacteria bacterium]|nr:thioredoxin domain-containing protein [Deltaproteobacteria bacterium]